MSIFFYCNKVLDPLFVQETFAQFYDLPTQRIKMILTGDEWAEVEKTHLLIVELSIHPNGDFPSLIETSEQDEMQKTYTRLELCTKLCSLWDCEILIDDSDPLYIANPYAYVHLTKDYPPRQVVANGCVMDADDWGLSIGRYRDEK